MAARRNHHDSDQQLDMVGRVILAMDHDDGGGHLAEKIHSLFSDLKLAEVDVLIDRPPTTGQDWNDVLRASMGKVEPTGP